MRALDPSAATLPWRIPPDELLLQMLLLHAGLLRQMLLKSSLLRQTLPMKTKMMHLKVVRRMPAWCEESSRRYALNSA